MRKREEQRKKRVSKVSSTKGFHSTFVLCHTKFLMGLPEVNNMGFLYFKVIFNISTSHKNPLLWKNDRLHYTKTQAV